MLFQLILAPRHVAHQNASSGVSALKAIPLTIVSMGACELCAVFHSFLQEVVLFFWELRRMFAAQEFCDLIIRFTTSTKFYGRVYKLLR